METCSASCSVVNNDGLSVSEIREAQDLEYFESLKADQEKVVTFCLNLFSNGDARYRIVCLLLRVFEILI